MSVVGWTSLKREETDSSIALKSLIIQPILFALSRYLLEIIISRPVRIGLIHISRN